MNSQSSLDDDFLLKFYGGHNELQWSDDRDRRFLKDWFKDCDPGLILLPRPFADREIVRWYAAASDDRTFRATRERLRAFLGASYVVWPESSAVLDENDPSEKVLKDRYGTNVLVLDAERQLKNEVKGRLELMNRLLEAKPSVTLSVPRPIGRIIGDWELAFRTGCYENCWVYFDELEKTGQLRAKNKLFFKIRLWGAEGKWRRIINDDGLNDLLMNPRPVRVTETLARAVFHVFLRSDASLATMDQLLRGYRENHVGRFAPLFTSLGDAAHPETLVAFAVNEACRDEVTDQGKMILDRHAVSDPYRELVEKLCQERTVVENIDHQARARDGFRMGDYDSAMKNLCQLEATEMNLQAIFQCAQEIETLESSRTALEMFSSADKVVQESLLKTRTFQKQFDELRGLAAWPGKSLAPTSIPRDWLEWFESLKMYGPWDRASDVATSGASTWDPKVLASDPSRVEALRRFIEREWKGVDGELFYRIFPLLVANLVPNEESIPALRTIHMALLQKLVLEERRSQELAVAYQMLCDVLLEEGVSDVEYADIATGIEMMIEKMSAGRFINWNLDMLDLLIAHPCNDPKMREGIFFKVYEFFQKLFRRVESGQWELLRSMATDLGHPKTVVVPDIPTYANEAREGEEEAVPLAHLEGKYVAIYTLTESVASRVKNVLEMTVTNIKVRTSSDMVGTDRLLSMAREADIFVIVTRSAKHAATGYIEANLPVGKKALFPTGRGTASILQVLLQNQVM